MPSICCTFLYTMMDIEGLYHYIILDYIRIYTNFGDIWWIVSDTDVQPRDDDPTPPF